MANSIRIRASGAGETTVKALITHPMETGLRKDKKTGNKIPAHYIKTMTFTKNGAKFAEASMGVAVSKNPLVSVRVSAKAGDKIGVSWMDNKGETGSASSSV